MRTPIIAGNWKMNTSLSEAKALSQTLHDSVGNLTAVDVVLCPPFTALSTVQQVISGSQMGLGAQNLHWEEKGAYTGEVAPAMVAELCGYVIIGHSERRSYFGETDETVNRKIKAALTHGLIPIVCVGESLAQNEAGETVSFVGGQIRGAFEVLSAKQASGIVVAYEPIWAIGTGRTASASDANAIISDSIRATLTELYDETLAQAVRVQYGGSVKPNNAADFFAQPDIDGALVGGASLKADSFTAIVQAG